MNYVYDIYLNFNEILYDIFDWNKNDKLIHIKKIPIFKVSEKTLKLIIYNQININYVFLEKIKEKTDLWNNNLNIYYCALFCDDNNMIAINFDSNGNSFKKSYLLLNEEAEILETINKLKENELEFKVLNKEKINFKTRKELKDENFINKELKKIDKNKLSYIYFECFSKHENNRNLILKKLKEVKKESKTYKNLYYILKITSTTKNKMI